MLHFLRSLADAVGLLFQIYAEFLQGCKCVCIVIESVVLLQDITLFTDVACSVIGICQRKVICLFKFAFVVFCLEIQDLQFQIR